MRMTGVITLVLAFAVVLIALAVVARAGEMTTFRDRSGNVTGTAQSNPQGGTTFRDRSGTVTGSAHTDSAGNTTFRNRSGTVTGTARTR